MKFLLAMLLALAPLADARAQAVPDTVPRTAPARDTVRSLEPGDIVRLRIWREPDLSGDFIVDETGVVVFPKIGPLRVTGASTETLKDTLVRSFQVYLRNLSIDVVLLRRVNVLGAVRNPGLYPVDPTMTLADVIAAAGGATPQGRSDRVELLRDGRTVTAGLNAGVRMADLRIRSGDQLFVPERSWASRNSGIIAAAITASVSLLIAIVR